jgi:2-polyprenyl-3-methyl-5-hydroxy-6-metoxy-1,4-benzoquinol methylase
MTEEITRVRQDYHDNVRHDVIPHIPKTGGRLLDVGGGIGATGAYLKANGYVESAGTIDMVDPKHAVPTLDFAEQANLEDGVALAQIGEARGPFRTIIALDVLEHLVDPWTMVARLHAMLEPDGVLVVSVPNVRHWRASLKLVLRNSWTYTEDGVLDRTHLRFFVRQSAVELVGTSGLVIEAVQTSRSSGKTAIFQKLTLGLFNSFTDLQYVIVGRNKSAPLRQ